MIISKNEPYPYLDSKSEFKTIYPEQQSSIYNILGRYSFQLRNVLKNRDSNPVYIKIEAEESSIYCNKKEVCKPNRICWLEILLHERDKPEILIRNEVSIWLLTSDVHCTVKLITSSHRIIELENKYYK